MSKLSESLAEKIRDAEKEGSRVETSRYFLVIVIRQVKRYFSVLPMQVISVAGILERYK